MSSLFDLAKLKKKGFKSGALLAQDPELLEKLMTHLGRTVKHDEVTKNLVFLSGTSAYTRDPINLFMRGPSCIGKSYNTTETLKYFPSEDIWMLGGLSPTALVHDYGVLVDAKGEEIDFAEKPTKSNVLADLKEKLDVVVTKEMVNEALSKEKKRWQERLKGSRYIVDLHQKILVFLEPPAIETYNKLRPILSHDKEEISYRFTDKQSKGKLRTTHVVLKGWPATIFCSTQERYVEDLATRGFTITPEMKPEKYKAAGKLTGEKRAHPRKFRQDLDFTLLQGYIHWLKHKLGALNVATPYAEKLADLYPFRHARSMRDFDHLTALIQISALFHYAQRPVEVVEYEVPFVETRRDIADKVIATEGTKHKEEYTILATMKDLEYVLNVWKFAEETTVTGLSQHILDFYHKAVEPIAELKEGFSYKELTQQYNEVSEQNKSSWAIRKWVKLLTEVGWLDTEPNPIDKRMVLVKVIKKVKNVGNSWNQVFSGFFTLEDFKTWLDEEKKILETESIILKENLLSEPTEIETLYKTHFISNNFPTLSELEPKPESETQPEITTFQESQAITPLLTFEQVLSGPHALTGELFHKGTCAICGQEKTIEWHMIDFKRQRREICGDCAWKFSDWKTKEDGLV